MKSLILSVLIIFSFNTFSQIDSTILELNYKLNQYFLNYLLYNSEYPDKLENILNNLDKEEVEHFNRSITDPLNTDKKLKYIPVYDKDSEKFSSYYLISKSKYNGSLFQHNDTIFKGSCFFKENSFITIEKYKKGKKQNVIIYKDNIRKDLESYIIRDSLHNISLLHPKYKYPTPIIIKVPSRIDIDISSLSFEIPYPITIKGKFYSRRDVLDFLKLNSSDHNCFIDLRCILTIDYKKNIFYVNNCILTY